MPTITATGTTIDGTSQTTNRGDVNSRGPEIEINGAAAGTAHGFLVTSANNLVHGLIINGFAASNMAGIRINNSGATLNTISGCYIGTNYSGTTAVPNAMGIAIYDRTTANTIGGTSAAERNVISGNDRYGIMLSGILGNPTTDNVIVGNYIGTTAAGDAPLANSTGIYMNPGTGRTTIGGTDAAARNVISGNGSTGISIGGSATIDNEVVGDFIGTDATGTTAIGNNQAITIMTSSTGNTIGGTTAAHRNIIAGGNYGVTIYSDANVIIGNYIGTDLTGTAPLGQGFYAVNFTLSGQSNVVGGTGPGEANLIANSANHGIYHAGTGAGNQFRSNSIHSCGGLGIRLNAGANNGILPPVLSSITASGSDFTAVATADPGDVIEFFRVNNPSSPVVTPDPSGSGEGYLYLGSCTDGGVATGPHISSMVDADPTAGVLEVTLLSSGLGSSDYVTITATDATDGTSAFAANVDVPVVPVARTWDGGAGSTNWGDAENWDPNGVPTSSDDVTLTGADIVDVNTAGVCNDIKLDNTSLNLTIKSGYSLAVSGDLTMTNGVLRTEETFPTVSGAIDLSGGTVVYQAPNGDQTVEVHDYNNLTINGGGTKYLAGTISIVRNLAINNSTFELGIYSADRASPGGAFAIQNSATLKIGGTGTLPANYSTHTVSPNSTIEYAGTTTSVAALNSSQTYGNLVISGTAVSTSNSIGVATALTVGGGASLIVSSGTVTMIDGSSIANSGTLRFLGLTIPVSATVSGSGNFAVAGTFTVNSGGTFVPAADEIVSGTGTLTGDGTVQVTRTVATADFSSQYTITTTTLANLTVEYAGSSAQTVSALTYGNLKMNNTSGATLGGNATVNGTLTFADGNITTGANSIYVSSTGSVSHTSGHVVGNLKKYIATGATTKIYEIGDATNYTPVDVAFASVSVAGDLTARSTAGDHPNIDSAAINAARTANRYWTLTNSGITFSSYDATFTFVAGDLDGGASTSEFIAGKYGAGWTYPTVGATTATTTEVTDVTSFSDFQLGEEGFSISGRVFEDANFAGTALDWDGGASDLGLDNVDVELYDAGTSSFLGSVITSAGGTFSFDGVADGTYKVRTRSATVGDADTPPAGGLHPTVPGTWPYPLPEMTWGNDAASIGGQDQTVDDTATADNAGPGDTQVTVTVSGADLTGVNFGFCYDLIVNVDDDANADGVRSKQGTLRQFIKNSNAIVGVNKSWFQVTSP